MKAPVTRMVSNCNSRGAMFARCLKFEQLGCMIYIYIIVFKTLVIKTNIAPKTDGWNTSFLLGWPVFRAMLVSGRVYLLFCWILTIGTGVTAGI